MELLLNIFSKMANKYQKLYNAAVDVYQGKKKAIVQKEVNDLWKEIKNDEQKYNAEIKKLKDLCRRNKSIFLAAYNKVTASANAPEVAGANENPGTKMVTTSNNGNSSGITEDAIEIKSESMSTPPIKANAHAQQKATSELAGVDRKISDLYVIEKAIGLGPDHRKELNSLQKSKTDIEKKLKRLKSNAEIESKRRAEVKKVLKNVMKYNPEIA